MQGILNYYSNKFWIMATVNLTAIQSEWSLINYFLFSIIPDIYWSTKKGLVYLSVRNVSHERMVGTLKCLLKIAYRKASKPAFEGVLSDFSENYQIFLYICVRYFSPASLFLCLEYKYTHAYTRYCTREMIAFLTIFLIWWDIPESERLSEEPPSFSKEV